jgi:hypothetical protein
MTEENTAPCGRLVTIAQVAAENIARVLELPEAAVAPLQEAIGDEVAAMSAHFAFTINDLHAQWEKAEGKLTRIREALAPDEDGDEVSYRVSLILDDEPTPQMGTVDLVEIPASGG